MIVGDIESAGKFTPLIEQQNSKLEAGNGKFSDTLKELISDTNSLQKEAAALSDKMIKGEPVDIHEVMISAEKAKTSFQLLMEIRNKFVDMYKELSRIQV